MGTQVFNGIITHNNKNNWVMVEEATNEGTEGLRMPIQDLAEYFYADDELFDLTQP